MRHVGATPGRGGHRREAKASQIADNARAALATLFHAPDPQGIAFTLNATQAINMALKGILRPGDHVITSSIEHNAVWRPLKALERGGVAVTAVPCAPDGALDPAALEAVIQPAKKHVDAGGGEQTGWGIPEGDLTAQGGLCRVSAGRSPRMRGVPGASSRAAADAATPRRKDARVRHQQVR